MEPTAALRVATRGSPLALVQTREALRRIGPCFGEAVRFELVECGSPGDRDQATPLDAPDVPDDFFTRDLDQALLRGEADLAIHSAKDLPARLPEGLRLAALLPAADIRDALVMAEGRDPDRDPPRTVGTSSPRRLDAVRALYPEARAVPIRGPIGRRLEQVDAGGVDAVIVAACALDRLGLTARITRYLPVDPASQQGRLAVVVSAARPDLAEALAEADVRLRLGRVVVGRGEPPHPALGPEHRRALLHAVETGDDAPWPRPEGEPLLPPEWDDYLDFFQGWGLSFRVRLDPGPMLASTARPGPADGLDPFVHFPVIETVARPASEIRAALDERLPGCIGILFPSVPAVEALTPLCPEATRRGLRALAVGPATAEAARAAGWAVEAEGKGVQGLDGFVQSLDGSVQGLDGAWLYPCSDAAPVAERQAAVNRVGMRLVPLVAYHTRARTDLERPGPEVGAVLFGSASGVDAYFDAFPGERDQPRLWIALGEPTQAALARRGLRSVRRDQVVR